MRTKLFDYSTLAKTRKKLHQHAELSGQEEKTADFLEEELKKLGIFELQTDLGGRGILATLDSQKPGPWVMFRSELDALPIEEENDFDHKSLTEGISHKCGHDGHMAILLGFAKGLKITGLSCGKVSLLFQPAEETGEGAQAMMDDPNWPHPSFDYVFALHNIPGFPLGHIAIKNGIFTPTVSSLSIHLKGKTSHAAEPEQGINPDEAIASLITALKSFEERNLSSPDFFIVTTIYIHHGGKNYGISPAKAELHFTLRCYDAEHMEKTKKSIEKQIKVICNHFGLKHRCNWFQEFQANNNESYATDMIRRASIENRFVLEEIEHPFRWGEDFGRFTQKYPGAMFGLGAGLDCPALHQDTYDFPDKLIPYGVSMFSEILEGIQIKYHMVE